MKSVCLPTLRLTAADREQMFDLLLKNFSGVDRATFDADLDEKNRVILIREHGELYGFSTFLYYTTRYRDERLGIVYSGDTIIAPDARASLELPRSWIRAVRETGAGYRTDRQYWLLIVSGFRTYRFLPVFWKEFYPRHDRQTPPEQQELLQHLAAKKFGKWFDANRGTVVFPRPQVLRASLAALPESRRSDPHVRYFERANPGWKHGDELVCLAEISDRNLTPAGRRMVFARHPPGDNRRASGE